MLMTVATLDAAMPRDMPHCSVRAQRYARKSLSEVLHDSRERSGTRGAHSSAALLRASALRGATRTRRAVVEKRYRAARMR